MGAYIPQALKNCKLWCVWKYETDEKGARRKPCFSADKKYNGKISKAADQKRPYCPYWQWKPYDDAFTKYTYTGDYDGVGFLFTDTCGFVFIDLDHCIQDDGEPNAFASEILDLFKGTFVEYSPSGTGLHIIVKGKIPFVHKSTTIELYGNGGGNQYGTVTGDVYDGTEPLYMQKQLDELIRRYDIKPKAAPPPAADQPITSDDAGVLAALNDVRRNDSARQFARLYAGEFDPCSRPDVILCRNCPNNCNGRTCFKSASEADHRLIRQIATYSRNFEQTARLFRSSGLYRPDKANDAYIRRSFDKAPQNAQKRPQEARNGYGGINTPPTTETPSQRRTDAQKRGTLTDTPEKPKIKRSFWK